MKVLWITNIPIAKHRDMLGIGLGQSGGWMETTYAALRENCNIQLGVVTVYNCSEIKRDIDMHNSFYILPMKESLANYDVLSDFNRQQWRTVIEEFKPDVIQLWGTEFAHGLCAINCAPNIPCVVYIQGMMSQIFNHSLGAIPFFDLLKYTTFKDLYDKKTFWHQRRKYKSKAIVEADILSKASGVIVENEWCSDNCIAIADNLKIYKSLLPINPLFSQYQWNINSIKHHTIFTTAGPSPIKGHHLLFKAISIVALAYPDVKLIIPGANFYFGDSFSRRIKRESYPNYLLALLKKFKIENNVEFIGRLSPNEMALNMQSCHVFAMPSAIENHSSTLIEAMMVGAPSVSAYVGGVSEYLVNGKNGFMSRFDEPEVMAANIIKIFRYEELAIQLSKNAIKDTREIRLAIDLEKDYNHIYSDLMKL